MTSEQTQKVIVGCAVVEVLALAIAWWLNWSPLGIGIVMAAGVSVSVLIVVLQRRG